MSVICILNPTGTTKKCKYGCGLMTVLADLGGGRTVRVHCGTLLPGCPGTNGVSVPRRAA
jgi:hypothetical protein